MLDEMPPGMLEQWQAYWTVEPFGQDWLRSALTSHEVGVLAGLVQAAFGSKQPRWPKLTDFMPIRLADEEKPKDTEEQRQQQRAEREQAAMQKAFGAR